MSIKTLKQFYDLMFETRNVRRKIVNKIIKNESIPKRYIKKLINALNLLKRIPKNSREYTLNYHNQKIKINLHYEIEELEKDIKFLQSPIDEFLTFLNDLNTNFQKDLDMGLDFLQDIEFNIFISDRDGTVNNYCGRYKSSIQSVYNAIFLIEFSHCLNNAIILTSAPLQNIGLIEVSIVPPEYFVLAGSKGREFFYNNQKYRLEISSDKQKKLNQLNNKLKKITQKENYEIFSMIGSGLQYKFGQTTIARQDIHNSIPEQKSKEFLQKIKEIVNEIDSENNYFVIIDTGKDIEIILKKDNVDDNSTKDFDKGDGTEFILEKLNINIDGSNNLICGDTSSDISILKYAKNMTKNSHTIFVTNNLKLQKEVKNLSNNFMFVNSPDALVSILYKYSQERRA